MGLPLKPQPSALQDFLHSHPQPRNSPHPSHLHHLALQVAHNLRFQHAWTGVRIHYTCPASPSRVAGEVETEPLPRPLLSGLPPRRLYVHPDEQVEILQKQHRRRQERAANGDRTEAGSEGPAVELLKSEREWVLPSHLREKWSLRRFGEVFDALPPVPSVGSGEELFGEVDVEAGGDGSRGMDEEGVNGEDGGEVNEWRMKIPKRLLLATLDDDSTVVYYIVHDGIVKPRQN